jgi:ABC-2 type transport system permease protein
MIAAWRSEWTKARTVPSSVWLLLLVFGGMVLLAPAVLGTLRVHDCGPDPCSLDTVKLSLAGVRVAQVGAAILGVLLVTSEYTTGMIAPTLTAVPRRWAVVLAKAFVVVVLVGVSSAAGVAGAMLIARVELPHKDFGPATGYPSTSLVSDLTQRAAGGTVLYLVLVALLGVGIGTLVRDTGVAVTVVMALLLVLPLLAILVPDPHWQNHIHRYAPMDAGLAVQSTRGLATLPIGPWAGLLLLAGYALAAVLGAAIAMQVRDGSRGRS